MGRPEARRTFHHVVGYALLAGGVLWCVVWKEGRRQRAVETLEAADRHLVFRNALENFRKLCVERQGRGFREDCDRQREFLLLFPECDSSCRSFLSMFEPSPTR